MDGWVDDGQIDEWIDEYVYECIDGYIGEGWVKCMKR